MLTTQPALAVDVNSETELRNAIFAANTGGDTTINITGPITLSQSLPMISSNITVNGGGFTVDANNAGRVFFIESGTVAINNVTVANARAQGGDGGSAGSAGGGGGLGAGAAVFVNDGASATLTGVQIADAAAAGGTGGGGGTDISTGGGGGLGGLGGGGGAVGDGGGGGYEGAGGSGAGGAGGGGGEFGAGGGGGDFGAGGGGGQQGDGGAGAPSGGAGGGQGGGATASGADGSGNTGGTGGNAEGGNGGDLNNSGQDALAALGGGGGGAGSTGGNDTTGGGNGLASGGGGGAGKGSSLPGGTGGTGGGGGGGGGLSSGGGAGGAGGDFGGGGGGITSGGGGGFGGGGGGARVGIFSSGGQGGFGGGGGAAEAGGAGGNFAGHGGLRGGGGGAALGGAIFVRDGGTLIINNGGITGTHTVTGGAGGGGSGTGGQALGSLMFLHGTGTTTLNIANGNTVTTSATDSIAGDGALIKAGQGTLVLNGNSTYSGATTLQEGTLSLGANSAAGTGTITTLGSVIDYADGVTVANPININSNTTQLQVDAGTATQAGNIGETSGPRPLEKIGSGKLILSGNNTYTGDTTVTAGTLGVGADNNLGNGGTLALLNGTTIDFTQSFTLTHPVTVAGDPTFNVGAGLTNTIASTIADGVTPGDVVKTGAGTLILTGDSTYTGDTTVAEGALAVTGSIVSSTTVNNGATLQGTGVLGPVTILSGGIYAPGNSIGTQTVNGAFTLAPGAIFEVEVNAAGQSDKVIVNGTVNLTGATLRVLAANGSYKPQTDYTIINNDGNDAVIGTFGSITSSLAFLTPTVIYNGGDGNDVVLTLTRNNIDLCDVANTRNQCNVANALNKFDLSDPLYVAVLNQTAAGARQAFDALSGEIHASVAGTLADDSRYVREAVLGRLMQAGHTGEALSAGGPQVASLDAQAYALGYDGNSLVEPAREPLAFWTRAYGAWGDFDGDGNAATADRDLGGFVSGMDANIGGSWRAGLATGASFSNVDVDARYSAADVESYHLGGYLGGMAGAFALRGGGLWAWSDIETSRAVVFPGFYERQKASYDADTGQLFGEVAYPTQMMGMALEPFGGLAYVSIDTDTIRERGGPLASLRGSADQDVGYSTLGLRAATTMMLGAMQVVPHVSAAWQHAFDDVTPDAALAFATTGIGFTAYGVPLAEDSALIDAGLDFALGPNTTAGVSYTGQFGEDVQDNGVKGRFTWLF